MDYISVKEASKRWNISERSVRNYCAEGRVTGAVLLGKTWLIPSDSTKPIRKNKKSLMNQTLLDRLIIEKSSKLMGGIYHKIQIELTYNSNHIEGSKLSHDQTRFIYETNTIGLTDTTINVDDIIETSNHFRCIDYLIDKARNKLTESFIKEIHYILKNGTSDSRKDWFAVGEYKKLANEVAGRETTHPSNVKKEIIELLNWYHSLTKITLNDIIEFHYKFERIHPFQDGNGRVGRLIMFKECLKHNVVPFIISDNLKLYYYRGLNEFEEQQGYLIDTCLTAQDRFKKYLDYFEIKYN